MSAPRRIQEQTLWDAYYNILEYPGKLRNGWLVKDEYLTRYAARVVAQYLEEVVIALNDLSTISENLVWHHVMRAKKKPDHFSRDNPLALRIKDTTETRRIFLSGLSRRASLRMVRKEFGTRTRHDAFRSLMEQTPAILAWHPGRSEARPHCRMPTAPLQSLR